MFTLLSDGHFTYFPKPELDEVLATVDRRPAAADHLVDDDVITSNTDVARCSWPVQKSVDLENPDFLFKIRDSTGFQ